MDSPEAPFGQTEEPSEDVISAYQRRLRRLRNVMLFETLVLVPLVVLLGVLLVLARVERGQVATIRFGTALEIAVRDEATAQRVVAQIKQRATAGGAVREGDVRVDPEPVIQVAPASDGLEPMTEMEALRAIQQCPDITLAMDAAIVKVDGEPIVAAASAEEVDFALEELVGRYSDLSGQVGPARVVTQYSVSSEVRPPDRVKTSRDALIALFEEEKAPDVYEFIGPNVSLETVLQKHGLSRERLQLMNRGVDLDALVDGSKLLVKPGRDRLEVEYELDRTDIRDIPPTEQEQEDPELEEGKRVVEREGVPGQERVVYRITYRNDREVDWRVASTTPVVRAEDAIVRVGTKKPAEEENARGR